MCASPGIARATCAPDSHHLQLSAVLVHALGSYFASPHAKAMAMQVSRARGTQWYVGSAANALARTNNSYPLRGGPGEGKGSDAGEGLARAAWAVSR